MKKTNSIIVFTLIAIFAFFLVPITPAQAAEVYAATDSYRWLEPKGDYAWAKDPINLCMVAEWFPMYYPSPRSKSTAQLNAGVMTVDFLGQFRPAAKVTKSDLATVISNAFQCNVAVPGKKTDIATPLDVRNALFTAAKSCGADIKPEDCTINTKNTYISRAQLACGIYKVVKKVPVMDGINEDFAAAQIKGVSDQLYELQTNCVLVASQETKQQNVWWNRYSPTWTGTSRKYMTEYNVKPWLGDVRLAKLNEKYLGTLTPPDWPTCDWAGYWCGYGLAESAFARYSGNQIPILYSAHILQVKKVYDLHGKGSIVHVFFDAQGQGKLASGLERKFDGEKSQAILVKQGGKWRVAALYHKYDYADWLKNIGY